MPACGVLQVWREVALEHGLHLFDDPVVPAAGFDGPHVQQGCQDFHRAACHELGFVRRRRASIHEFVGEATRGMQERGVGKVPITVESEFLKRRTWIVLHVAPFQFAVGGRFTDLID